MSSQWDTRVPAGADDPPVAGASRFDLNDPFEVRAGPFWSTTPPPGQSNTFDDENASSNTFWVRVQQHHCNSSKIVHGGLLMTLADLTMADAARDGNGGWVTVSFNSQFVLSAELGDLLEVRELLGLPASPRSADRAIASLACLWLALAVCRTLPGISQLRRTGACAW
jgi:acyl-coenzyme A thioesterase PaaI-like protein